MHRLLILLLALPFAACTRAGDTMPSEGCRGHGGVTRLSDDATNNRVPFSCKDGTVGWVKM